MIIEYKLAYVYLGVCKGIPQCRAHLHACYLKVVMIELCLFLLVGCPSGLSVLLASLAILVVGYPTSVTKCCPANLHADRLSCSVVLLVCCLTGLVLLVFPCPSGLYSHWSTGLLSCCSAVLLGCCPVGLWSVIQLGCTVIMSHSYPLLYTQ